jgi:hypothetical protein
VSLFVCDECGVVENTALAGFGGYWGRNRKDLGHGEQGVGDGKARCSQCNPQIGKWHGCFPRGKWDGKRQVINR